MIFAITFVNMNKHTCKLFKNIFDDVRTKGDGEINTAYYSRNCILIHYEFKSLKSKFLFIPEPYITIKECKIDLSNNI